MKAIKVLLVCGLVLGFNISISQATVYEFDIFSQNGQYYDGPGVDITVDVTSSEAGTVDFTFFNNSTVQSPVARIYFDDGTLLGIDHITNGPGTKFSKNYSGPADLINESGVGEWVTITFDLKNEGTFADVLNKLK
ncbi:MAG: hypothetical protein ACYSRR_01660 [Planctomycetota bacterium]|jgi:hypothetical protein